MTNRKDGGAEVLNALDMIFEIFQAHCENLDIDMPDDEDSDLLEGCKAEIKDALRQHQQDGEWLPIETCPKIHGVDYRLWDADDNEERITWYGNGEWCFEGNYTHWMPLPPAPKKENDDGGR